MKRLFVLAILIFILLGCHSNKRKFESCSPVGDVLKWKKNNFTVIAPADKYGFDDIYNVRKGCPKPSQIRVPNSAVIVEDLLSIGMRINIFVLAGVGLEDGEGVIADCEGLYLKAFGRNGNFSIIDRIKLNSVLREQAIGQTGLISEVEASKAGKLAGATHIYHITASVAKNGPFKTVYFSGRLIEIESGQVLSIDRLEN
jgi:hypothetical protein